MLMAQVESGPAYLTFPARKPLALVVMTPSRIRTQLPLSEWIREVGKVVRKHTDLEVSPLRDEALEGCAGKMRCILSRVPEKVRFTLVMAIYAGEGDTNVVAAYLVDRSLIPQCKDSADPEPCLFEKVVVLRQRTSVLKDRGASLTFIDRLITLDAKEQLKSAGHWLRFGKLQIHTNVEASVFIDGQGIGQTQSGRAEVADVPVGSRRVRLFHPERLPYETEVKVTSQETTAFDAHLVRIRSPASVSRTVTLYVGGAAALAGAVFSIWGIQYRLQHAKEGCSGGGCGRFWSVEQMIRGQPQSGTDVSDDGHWLAIPLGYSLLGAGGVWTVGTWLLGNDRDWPWLQWLVGAAVGGAAYGISAALQYR